MVQGLITNTDMNQNNELIYESLSKKVAEQFFSRNCDQRELKYSQLEINNFSICFGIDTSSIGTKGVYVKIPKVDLYLKNSNIFPLTEEDKRFADQEYQSLRYLAQYWKADDLGISFIKVLGFLREYNAIVTEKIFAKDIYREFRKIDLLNKCGNNGVSDYMRDFISRFGIALSRFHNIKKQESVFEAGSLILKIEKYCGRLKSFKICNYLIDQVLIGVRKLLDYSAPTFKTITLKGLDLRNIFIDCDRHIYLLDPGAMKNDYREADLARFIVTLRLLYWGSPWFFLQFSANKTYEGNLLRGYNDTDNLKVDNKILSAYILKELLKHWHMAYVILNLKPWPLSVKRFLRYSYIDPFYNKQIKAVMLDI